MDFKANFFERASFLRREEIGATVVSAKFLSEDNANREIFLLDHNVLDSISMPWRNGPQKGEKVGFGQILPRRSQWNFENTIDKRTDAYLNELQRDTETEDEVAERLLEVLCEHVIQRIVAPGLPIFQSKFHAEETENSFDGLRRKIQREGLSAGNLELRQTLLSNRQLALVSAALRDGDDQSVTDFIDELIYKKRDRKLQGFSSLTLALDKYDALSLNHPNYELSAEQFASRVDDDNQVFEALSVLDEITQSTQIKPEWSKHHRMLWAAYRALVRNFESSISRGHAAPDRKAADTNTLAWIFVANLELYRLARTDIRFVFLTLDQSLVRTAYSLSKSLLRRNLQFFSRQAVAKGESLEEFGRELLDFVMPERNQLSTKQARAHPSVYFALNFVRHIWGYLGDCFGKLQAKGDAIRQLRHAQTGVKDNSLPMPGYQNQWDSWKNLFSGAFPDNFGVLGFKELEKNSMSSWSSYGSIRNSAIGEVLDRYEELISDAIRNIEFIDAERNSRLRKAISKAIKLQDDYNWNKLADQINDELTLAKLRALVSISQVGAQVVSSAVQLGSRHPPNLSFESLPATNQIFERLYSEDGYLSHGDFFDDFEGIVSDCWNSPEFDGVDYDDRQEIHLKLLVLGAAFASADRWPHAFQNALRALEIIERRSIIGNEIPVKSDRLGFNGTKSFISGREAYFLASVAKRVSAKSQMDLEPGNDRSPLSASDFLHKARACLYIDHERGTGLGLTDLRFDAEELGLKLSQYYMARFDEANAEFTGNRSSGSSFVDRYEDIRASCMALYSARINSTNVSPLTAVNCATNILQACVSTHYRKKNGLGLGRFENRSMDELVPLQDFAIKQCENETQKNGIVKTILIEVYIDVSKLILDPALSKDVHFVDVLRSNINKGAQRNVAAYDQWRYEELESFVNDFI